MSKATSQIANQGQFHPHPPRSEPLHEPKHQIGNEQGNARVSEFHAEIHPPGTAPSSRTFHPNPDNSFPRQTSKGESITTASETLCGATSRDVDRGLGHPMDGQTSHELRHDGHRTRKHYRSGLEGVGASGGVVPGKGRVGIDERDPKFAEQRGLEREDARPRRAEETTRGGANAEDKVPMGAEAVAAEAPRK